MKILLIQDNPEYTQLLSQSLKKHSPGIYTIESARNLRDSLPLLDKAKIDVVLLELSLPDSEGLNTFLEVQKHAPQVPVIILGALYDEMIALKAVRSGAEEYILKGEVEGKSLPRLIRHAVERHRMKSELQTLSLTDELTKLHNRRGFTVLGSQQLKLARRNKARSILMLFDLNGFKAINDTYGHQEGDAALIKVAQLMKETFRQSDILARIGGDEFGIFAIDAGEENAELLKQRFYANLQKQNQTKNPLYQLSLSIGIACSDPTRLLLMEDLITTADQDLYRHKKKRKSFVK